MTLLRGEWRWSDADAPHGVWWYFFRSGECLTTLLLWGYAAIFLLPGDTFARSRGFAWLDQLSHGREWPWGVWSFALAIVAPLAVVMDDGRLRVLGVFSQALLFGFLALSFSFNSTPGLGWVTFAGGAIWLVWRGGSLVVNHARR